MKYDLRQELEKLRLGCEDLREDLWSPYTEEGNKISAGEIEIVNQVKEIREDDDLVEDQTKENEALDDLIVVAESYSNLTRIEEVALRATMAQLRSYQKEVGVGILASESFATCDYQTLATESLKNKLKAGVDKVVEMTKMIWEKVVAFFTKLFSSDKKLLAKLEVVKTAIEKSDLQGGLKLTPKDYFVNLSIEGKVDVQTITKTFARLSRLHDSNTLTISKILESEGKDPDAFNRAVMGEYYKIVETIAENTDANENNEKITYINDAWEYGIERGREDSSKIFIRSRKANSLSETNTLSKDDALITVKNIGTILGINNDQILKTANTIIRKMKFDNRLFKEFAPELSALGRFVIERAKLRHDICNYAINYLEENLKSNADS